MNNKLLILVAFSLIQFACNFDGQLTNPQKSSQITTVSVYFDKPSYVGNLVISALVSVSASDMDTISATLIVTDTSVYGTIEAIPAGQNRKFEIFCYDADSILTYYGNEYADLQAGGIQTIQIILYPVDRYGKVIIVGIFSPYPPSVEKIVFQADYSGSSNIYIMNPDGNAIKQLTDLAGATDFYPHISFDKKKIVFCRSYQGTTRPYMMNIDGSDTHEIDLPNELNVGFCTLSPDGQQLAFHTLNDGDPDIYIYDLNSKEIAKILENDAIDWIPDWSPLGSEILFYSNMSGIHRAYLIKTDGTNLHSVDIQQNTEEKVPRFSPDGHEIVMMGREGYTYSAWDLYLVKSDGSSLRKLIDTPHVNEEIPCWSPNGEVILFKRSDGGPKGYGLYMINKDGTGYREVLDTSFNEENAHWQ